MEGMEKVVNNIVEFIEEVVHHAKADGVVIGISGGIDSALTGKLCTMALGKENVHGMFLPYEEYASEDAFLVRTYLDIPIACKITIKDLCHEVSKSTGISSDLTYGNVKARMRMICLYAYANDNNVLVVGTSNKSEMMTGYFTKYGDGGVDFEPIGNLYKTEVWEMAKFLGLPQKIIDKTPSAELWDGQTDEGELGVSYKELDQILDWISSGYLNPECIAHKVAISESKVRKVLALYKQTEHKRHMPLTSDRFT